MNQHELLSFMKRKRRFLSAKDISKETKDAISTVNRKLRKLCPKIIKKKIVRMQVGVKSSYKRPIALYKAK